MRVLITCEHGGNRVPAAYRELFRGQRRVLPSHRAYDPGSLELARHLAHRLQAKLFWATTTRLLVELNRSLGHPQLFSEFTRSLDRATRETLLRQYYDPYRTSVEDWITQTVQAGHSVLHISVHSFTPRKNGITRRADVGLLYDPGREQEQQCAARWRNGIRSQNSGWNVRRNYPYLGKADGFTTALRRRFAPWQYLGLELEVNQRWVLPRGPRWRQLSSDLTQSLARLVAADGCGALEPRG